MNASLEFLGEDTNLVIPEIIHQYITEFTQFSRKTAESIIQMGLVVYEAKSKLSSDDFEIFCKGIRFNTNSSSIRKLHLIGEKYELLKAHVDKLPSSWTTIYQLSQASKEIFKKIIHDASVNPTMTGSRAKLLISRFSNPDPKLTTPTKSNFSQKANDGFNLIVTFDFAPDNVEVIEFESSINALLEKFGNTARLRRSQQLDRYLERD